MIDVSDAENPEVINRIPRYGVPSCLEISDTLLYLCGGDPGFSIFSISEPEQLVEIGFCAEVNNACGLELRDTLAFIACYRTGLDIVSIADPYHPHVIGEYRPGWGDCDDVALMGDYAYLSAGTHIISIDDPTNPELIISIDGLTAGEIEIIDDIFYDAVKTYSLENPLEPRFISYYRIGDNFNQYSFDLDNNHIFLGFSRREDRLYKGISCQDISDPEHLREIGYAEMSSFDPCYSSIIEYEDDYVYVISGEYGMSICDFRDLDNPNEAGTYQNATFNQYNIINGDYLYVSDKHKQLCTYSIEDPHNPVLVDSLVWNVNSNDGILRMVGNEEFICLYIAHERDGRNQEDISVISLAEPDSPEEIGWRRFNLSIIGTMVLHEDYLFFTHEYTYLFPGTVTILSLTNPENPEIIGHFGEYEHGYGLDIEGDLMAVGFRDERDRGLVLADISDVENIVELCRFDMDFEPLDIKIIGDYLYLDDGDCFFVFTISDPENPEIIHEIRRPNHSPINCFYKDGFLLISKGLSGFEILSLENPDEPILTGRYHTPESVQNLVLRDRLVYTAEVSNLGIYDVSRAMGAWYFDLSADSHAFGEVYIDSTAEWELTIRNLSEHEREITDITTDNEVFNCRFDESCVLAANSDTTVVVSFTPAVDTSYACILNIVSGDYSIEVPLSGRGIRIDAVAEEPDVVYDFNLWSTYPNPFNAETLIHYSLPVQSDVELAIFDLYGRRIKTLVNEPLQAGHHTAIWDSRNENDIPVSSGLYFYRINAGNFTKVRKMTLVK